MQIFIYPDDRQLYVIVHRVIGLDLPPFITDDFDLAVQKLMEWRGYGYNPLFCYTSEEKSEM